MNLLVPVCDGLKKTFGIQRLFWMGCMDVCTTNAMHYLKGLNMSLDLPEIETNRPEKYLVSERKKKKNKQNGRRNVNLYQ